ncbi:Hypothetical predicted protein [Xyrichtys novacula]|uniref:Uncharacterized protein n=1 Tax=Xyrichtys novacula TaxID=13765 RepID=A0AAV1HF68_XYRNO|nr:Hypothetical predicted protein [Xyrichtys novacula]
MAMPQQKEACVWGAGAGREKRRTRETESEERRGFTCTPCTHYGLDKKEEEERKSSQGIEEKTDSDCQLSSHPKYGKIMK